MNERLTKREQEVLKLLADGFSTPEIGDKLHISQKTVKNHRANMMEKTKTRNVAHLIAMGFRRGLLGVLD